MICLNNLMLFWFLALAVLISALAGSPVRNDM